MSPPDDALLLNVARVREQMARAAERSGRSVEEITLIAVSKTHPAGKIQELYDAGVHHFGENRVQELESKAVHLTKLDAVWHMIGHVQKNKAARAAALFTTIDSLDSTALALRLDRAREELAKPGVLQPIVGRPTENVESAKLLRVLIEVKLDPQPAKSGLPDEEVSRVVDAVLKMPHLELRGLMGVPPYFENPEEARPYFQRLYKLRSALRDRLGPKILPVLSMGMSHDFEMAIEEGATEVRIGTALFGERAKA